MSDRAGTVKNLLSKLVGESREQIIYITDAGGNIMLCVSSAEMTSPDAALETLPIFAIAGAEDAEEGAYVDMGTLEGTFQKKRVTIVRQITDTDGTIVGALFFSESTL